MAAGWPAFPRRRKVIAACGRGGEAGMSLTWYVGGAAAVIVVETALIVWLLRHRAAGRRAQQLSEDRLRFETLLADLSAKLIHVEARGLDAALGAALQQAVSFLGMDRGHLDE